jgi:hypothetical protein
MVIVSARLLPAPRQFAPINYQAKIFGNISQKARSRGECWKRLEGNFGAHINYGATNFTARGHMAIRRRQMWFITKRPDERG